MVLTRFVMLLGAALVALGGDAGGAVAPPPVSVVLDEVYPVTTVVVDVVPFDVVTVATFSGIVYTFPDEDGDWIPGDIASLLMQDAGAPDDVTDDTVLRARYSGWVGDPETGEGWEDWFYGGWYWTEYRTD